MGSGCAADVQRMHSGGPALRLLWLKQKKTGVPMTAPQNRPKILRTPHHLYLREFCVKLGRNRGNRPNFAPVAFLVGTTRVALRAAQRKTLRFMDGASLYLRKLSWAQTRRKIVLLRRVCAFHFLRRNIFQKTFAMAVSSFRAFKVMLHQAINLISN